MVHIIFRPHEGEEQVVLAAEGLSIMKVAVNNGIEAIIGDCGGNLSCGTCHAYISPEWRAKLPPPSGHEIAMIDCLADATENSRLTCQITIVAGLDNIVVDLPPPQ